MSETNVTADPDTARVPRIALIADDLTSAGDGAAPFREAGFPARIILQVTGLTEAVRPVGIAAGITAVDLDSRAAAPAVAEAVTTTAMERLSGADIVFKTVDSTVRGHLAVEIRAALTASGRRSAMIAPAFPEEGRTTVRGIQLLDGVPVHATSFARDPAHPVLDADLRNLIPGAVLSTADAIDDIPSLIGKHPFVIADAATDHDLDLVVAAVPRPEEVLWVGSPGLARALTRKLAALVPAPAATVAELDDASPPRRVLTIVGSLHSVSREQSMQLSRLLSGAVSVSDDTAFDNTAFDDTHLRLTRHGSAILSGPDHLVEPDIVPARLADLAARLASRHSFDALVLTGGQTARAVLLALGARTIRLTSEPEPGIALGLLDRPVNMPVALKAGGFGDPQTLLRLNALLANARYLTGGRLAATRHLDG